MPRIPRGRVIRQREVAGGGRGTLRVSVVRPFYDRRDLLGHFAKPPDEMQMCPHKCCRNRRVHPERLPVEFDKAYLRSLSEPELIRHLTKYSNFTEQRRGAFQQITAEFDRRDRAERAKRRRQTREEEWRDEVYRQALAAEASTNGYMLSRRGQREDIDPISLFTGPESRVRAYASEELTRWFESHGRPTRQSFLGSARERRRARESSRIG